MPGRRLRLSKKGLHEDARRLRSVPTGNGGGVTPHPLLGPFHSDTDIASPAEGALVLADDTPEWNILLHPAAAGYAMVTDAITWTIDQTPTWTGDHTWDDGTGDSPAIHLIPENNDDWHIWAANDATPGNSDLIIKFPAADTDAFILFRDSGDNDVAHIDGDGNTAWDGAAHRFGIADTVAAIVTVSGHATGSDEGGQFTFELADDYDAVFNSWNVDANQDDLRFFRSDAGVINSMTAEGLLTLSVAGATGGLLIASDAQWYRSAANVMATPDDLYLAGAGLGIIHVDGVVDGQVLVANGTRYVPGTLSDITGGDAQFVVMALDATLANERVLTAGDGLSLTDAGAGAAATLDVDLVAAWSGLEFAGGELRVDLDAIYSWTGAHYHSATVVMDDGAGDSPALQFVGGSNDDTAVLYLVDDAVAGNSDFAIALSGTDTDSQFQIKDSGFATVAWINADGDASFKDVTIATGKGIIHADGVLAGWILVANGTRYVPANPAASLPIAPGDRGHIIRGEAGPVWASYNADTLGAVLIGDGTDIISDTTPTLVGDLTLDKNGGNSPLLHFITVSDDEIKLLADDTNGDFRILLSEAAGVSSLLVEDSAGAQQFAVTSDGDATVTGTLTVPQYIIHALDPDTYIEFAPDEIALWAGAAELLTITEAGTNTILFGAQADLNGNDLIIDTDGDSYLHESADDVVDLVLAGAAGEFGITINAAEDFTFTANSLNILEGSSLYLSEYAYHYGDVDTYLRMQADNITLQAGGVDMLDLVEGGTDYADFPVGLVFVDRTGANAFMTQGINIDQAGAGNQILALNSNGDVAHAMTTQANTDTYAFFSKFEDNTGGLMLTGLKQSGEVDAHAIRLRGFLGEPPQTTKSAASYGVVTVGVWEKDGTTVKAVAAAGSNAFSVDNNGDTLMIIDIEGDIHLDAASADGTDGVVNTTDLDVDGYYTFDAWDDAQLTRALDVALHPDEVIRSEFDEFLRYGRDDLERARIATFNDDGHHFVNITQLQRLHNGAIWQLYQRLGRYEKVLLEMGANPALLEAQ